MTTKADFSDLNLTATELISTDKRVFDLAGQVDEPMHLVSISNKANMNDAIAIKTNLIVDRSIKGTFQ